MFGWEFPPIKSGGLGTACYGITKGLAQHGVMTTFVLPHAYKQQECDFAQVEGLFDRYKEVYDHTVKVVHVNSLIRPYQNVDSYSEEVTHYHTEVVKKKKNDGMKQIYSNNLFEEVERYAQMSKMIALDGEYDLIHCHDWMTYQAGIAAKKAIHKPLIIHVHATEFDRTGGHPNQHVYDIEHYGMHEADMIMAVSEFTKGMICEHYGIAPSKVCVIHNAVENADRVFDKGQVEYRPGDKVVLFLGRVTLQKGPDYFLKAAVKVKELEPNVKFIVAGSGDMEAKLIRGAAEMGLAKDMLFTGFLQGEDVDRAFQLADVYVMPSVSEPFGITPLESLINGTPVIISKQSGVSEVLSHCLKVDFWDIDRLVNQIVAVLRHKILADEMVQNGQREVKKLTWERVGAKVKQVYNEMVA